jgi:hypothetical protein
MNINRVQEAPVTTERIQPPRPQKQEEEPQRKQEEQQVQEEARRADSSQTLDVQA